MFVVFLSFFIELYHNPVVCSVKRHQKEMSNDEVLVDDGWIRWNARRTISQLEQKEAECVGLLYHNIDLTLFSLFSVLILSRFCLIDAERKEKFCVGGKWRDRRLSPITSCQLATSTRYVWENDGRHRRMANTYIRPSSYVPMVSMAKLNFACFRPSPSAFIHFLLLLLPKNFVYVQQRWPR